MQPPPLHVTLIQADIIWEDKQANMRRYEQYFAQLPASRHIVLLPEMCTTGFSMNPKKLAEPMDGPTVSWLRQMASQHRCIIAGSFVIEEAGMYFNRLIWMQPDGNHYTYDKRHLFAFAGEDAQYTGGHDKLLVQVNGWKICPLICYDLRFPVWSRNVISHLKVSDDGESDRTETEPAYDLLLYVANWPERRSYAWKQLLAARAIENQAFVVGLNRVGADGAGVYYSGDSSVYDAMGALQWTEAHHQVMHTITLHHNALMDVRNNLPFLRDADPFLFL